MKDLLRGKCTFTEIEDIYSTVDKLETRVKQCGHKFIEIKNRLHSHTKDMVLIIKLPHSIAELQLVLKLDSVSNEFNHKLYELLRSKIYTPIVNLVLHNQRWSESFFTEFF